MTQQNRTQKAHEPKNRPERVPMGSTAKLGYPSSKMDTEQYQYRWFQDKEGRIDQAKQAWWEQVKEEDGEIVRRASGAFPMFLMRIEKKYWEEDQQLKHQRVIATMQEEQKLSSDEYLPGDKHHVLQKDDYDPLG
tara:strand:- start:30391 stop:30795 length:405 start_codon:yes stop_codon:yes gene_type:complete